MIVRTYIKLSIYNYDASPRYQRVELNCNNVATAKDKVTRLRRLMGSNAAENRTRPWVDRNFGIDGIVTSIDGIFEEKTEQVLYEGWYAFSQ